MTKSRLSRTAPLPITCGYMGRESITEQSLGVNKAELVVWAYLGTHKISNNGKGSPMNQRNHW